MLPMMHTVFKALAALVLVYVLLAAGLLWAMRQPPERFGGIMSRVPDAAFMVLPFKPLWLYSRAGALELGEPAPDFRLQTQDRSGWVQLSALRGRPVVLVFGSYT